jgi:predicted permease
MRIIGFVDSVRRDLRYALRGLSRRPAFSVTAVLTLALGIGATTAIFSVVYSVLIKPLPYPNAEELVSVSHAAPGVDITGDRLGEDPSMYLTYRVENRTFAGIGLWQQASMTETDRGESERVSAVAVTDGTLQALGVQPLLGRWFTEQETLGPEGEGQYSVILSYAFWQRRFGGDQAVLGRELSLDAQPSHVVGVMPKGFRFLDLKPQPDVIVALRLDPARQTIGGFSWQTLGRLAPGVTPAEARADLERMLPIWLDAWPSGSGLSKEALASWRITPMVRSLRDDLVGGVASMLRVLMGAIAAVLLIASANVANLMLVRADSRRPELAIRAALGAPRERIARELLVESLVLGAVGGALGLLLAYLGTRLLVAVGPSNLPRLEEIAVYPPVLAFTVAVSLASTLLFGSIPALKTALRLDSPSSGVPRGSSATRERSATRGGLVVVQVALALVLVVSAALMVRTFQALRDVDPGFADPETIQTARIWISAAQFPDAAQYTRMQHEMLDKMAALPGVTAASFVHDLPMEGLYSNIPVVVEGETLAAGETPPLRRWVYVAPGYFEAMGTRMIAGRDVTWSDIESGGRVVVISEDFAREIAAEPAAALGRRVRFAGDQAVWREVIGVVQSVRQDGPYEAPPVTIYWPVLRDDTFGTPSVAFVIRSGRAGTASLMEEVRQAVRSVNRNVPITLEGTMQDLYSESLARTSFTVVLLAIAGFMALALGVIGIYGVIAYVVSQRTREIGIRSALGAEPRRLATMFLLHGLRLSGIGVALGLVVAAAMRRSISSLLFGVEPLDLPAYFAALAVIASAAALASYLPARRAAVIDPVETLRAE